MLEKRIYGTNKIILISLYSLVPALCFFVHISYHIEFFLNQYTIALTGTLIAFNWWKNCPSSSSCSRHYLLQLFIQTLQQLVFTWLGEGSTTDKFKLVFTRDFMS